MLLIKCIKYWKQLKFSVKGLHLHQYFLKKWQERQNSEENLIHLPDSKTENTPINTSKVSLENVKSERVVACWHNPVIWAPRRYITSKHGSLGNKCFLYSHVMIFTLVFSCIAITDLQGLIYHSTLLPLAIIPFH